VDEPLPGRLFAVAPIEATVGELEIVVVARKGRLTPPLSDETPGSGHGHHAAPESLAAQEVGTVAIAEDLDRSGRAEHAHDEPAAALWRPRLGEAARPGKHERGDGGGTRAGGIHDCRRANPLRATERCKPGERRRQPLGRRPGWLEETELGGAHPLGMSRERDVLDGGAGRPRLEIDAQAGEDRPHVARRRGERELALVAAAIVEPEREPEPRAPDPLQAEPGEGALDQATQDEEERFEVVERVLEGDSL